MRGGKCWVGVGDALRDSPSQETVQGEEEHKERVVVDWKEPWTWESKDFDFKSSDFVV